jgi:hypothetical protein
MFVVAPLGKILLGASTSVDAFNEMLHFPRLIHKIRIKKRGYRMTLLLCDLRSR